MKFRIWTHILTGVVYADLYFDGAIVVTMSAKELIPYNLALYAYNKGR